MANPTLLAAVTVMLLMPSPKRLMLGYLLGAYTTSISVGLAIVFVLHDSGAVDTSKRTIGPGEDIVVGLLLILIAFVLGTDRDQRLRERKARRKREKQAKNGARKRKRCRSACSAAARPGSPSSSACCSASPASPTWSRLGRIDGLDAGAAPTALLVIAFCLIQQMLLEVPLIGYALAPERTQGAVDGFRDWLARNGRRFGIIVAAVLGALLIIRGLAGLVS